MERLANVLRHKRTGDFMLQPFGTFKGYGAYSTIYPYQELSSDVEPISLGELVIELLALSGPTGFHINNYEEYVKAVGDKESHRIRSKYKSNVKGTADEARKYLVAEVSKEDRHKSWLVTEMVYDSGHRSMVGGESVRVKVSQGPEALGQALLDMLEL